MSTTHEMPDDRLLLRLCCWHESQTGESTMQNNKLFQSFSAKELDPSWTLETATPSGRHGRTKIVPISIHFRHRSLHPTHEEAERHGENLWNAIITPTVDICLKSDNISPIAVVLEALNDDLAPKVRVKFTHYKITEDWRCKIKPRIPAPPKPPMGWRFSVKSLLGFGKQAVETADHLGRPFHGKSQEHKTSGIPPEPPSQGNTAKAGKPTQQTGRTQSAQSGRSGQSGGKPGSTIDMEQTKATLESVFKLGSAADALIKENEAHHRALTNDININHERLGNPIVVFESTMNDILAGMNSIVVRQAPDPQQADHSARMGMTDIDAGALHITCQAMRDMMKVYSIVEENLENLVAAIRRKRDSEIQPWHYVTGGLTIVAYAGGLYICPGWAIYAWVTGSLATTAVIIGGTAGGVSTGYGIMRWWNEEDKKAKERWEKVTDDFNHLKRVLNRYFATLTISYYERVFHIPFQELNDIDKRQCLISFGLDADFVSEKEYIGTKIEKGAEELGLAKDRFNNSFEELLKGEALSSIKRSYV